LESYGTMLALSEPIVFVVLQSQLTATALEDKA
jgi:hypothetical protein